jgi:hypothetical protein
MWARRSSPPKDRPRRYILLRLVLLATIVLLAIYVLPTPWALHIGGRFTPLEEWDGYGPVQASNGGHYLLFTHFRGGILATGHTSCSFRGCNSLTGTAQLCAQGGQRYTFTLTGAVHGWASTNGARTDLNLTGGTPASLPHGWVVAFHGVWHGPALPVATSSLTKVFTPAGAIRPAASAKDAGTASGTLRFGTTASFDHACRVLAGQAR